MVSWWPDELSTVGAEHLDAGYVAAYDAKAQVDPTEDIDVLRRYGLNDTSTIVDLGAGTGSFTVVAAPIARTVIAVDPSPAMLELPDLWKVVALRRVAALLRPGGVLRLRDLVIDAAPDQVEATIEAWMARAVDDPARGYTAEEFAEHLRSEFSTFTWLLEPMLERTGFEIVEREVRASIYTAYTCRRR